MHPQFSFHRLVVKPLISFGFNHGRSLGPRRRPASNRSRARLPSASARLPSRCKGNTSLEILHEADIMAMKARPQLFDVISGSTGRGTTEDAESRTSSPRPMYRRLLTAASSQPGRHPQGHTIDVKLRPTFDQSSPLHVAVKQALGSKTNSALELPQERNRHVSVDFIFLKSGNMSNYGLGLLPTITPSQRLSPGVDCPPLGQPNHAADGAQQTSSKSPWPGHNLSLAQRLNQPATSDFH